MKKNFLFLILAVLTGCSVLTESQLKNINAFGASAKNYSGFPGEIFKKKAALRFNEALLRTTQLPTADLIKENLQNAQTAYDRALQLSDKFDLSLRLIQQYAGLLTGLSSGNFVENLNDNTTELGENLGALIETYNAKLPAKLPAGISGAFSKAVFLAGERLTKNRQAKSLKNLIPQGDKLVQATVKNLVEVFETDAPSLKELLEGDRASFINSYTNIVLSNRAKVDYNSIRRYAQTLAGYDNLEAMRKQCIDAANKLAAAHAQLNKSIEKKRKLPEIFTETQDFIASVRALSKTFDALSNTMQS